jgi:hypothetical protein
MTGIRRRGHLSLVVSAPAVQDAVTEQAIAATGPAAEAVPTRASAAINPAAPPAPLAAAPDTGGLPADAAALVRLVTGAPVATPA